MKHVLFTRVMPISILAFISIALLSNSPNGKEKNIQKVRAYWDEVWNKGNLQAVADFYHPNAKHGEDFTIEGFQKGVKFQREAFPDFKAEIIDIFAVGDKVITEVLYTGTHTGRKMFKQDPLGKTIKVPGLDIFTFKDGKCINHQHVADHLDLIMQMGIKLVPTNSEQNAKLELEKLMQLSRDWSGYASMGDIENTMKYWADSAVMVSPNQPILNGKMAIRNMVEGSLKANAGFKIDWEPSNGAVSLVGDMGYLLEKANITIKDAAGKPVTQHFNSVTIWKKQADGNWKNVVDAMVPAP